MPQQMPSWFSIGALIALIVLILVLILLVVDEFTVFRAGIAIIALAVARLLP